MGRPFAMAASSWKAFGNLNLQRPSRMHEDFGFRSPHGEWSMKCVTTVWSSGSVRKSGMSARMAASMSSAVRGRSLGSMIKSMRVWQAALLEFDGPAEHTDPAQQSLLYKAAINA
jgi:hypothetical protein